MFWFWNVSFPQSAINMAQGNKYSLGQLISLELLHKLYFSSVFIGEEFQKEKQDS